MAEVDLHSRYHRVISVMGTVFTIDIRDEGAWKGAVDDVLAWWHWVDATFSPFKDDSAVSRINQGAAVPKACVDELNTVLSLCEEAKLMTEGYFDAFASGAFDPCGIVKGWSVEVASTRLVEAGSRNHCINAGGDVRCHGMPEAGRGWGVGIADPLKHGRLGASVVVIDGAVATSGVAERGRHVLDPHTGRMAADLASVTVLGTDLTWVDAYATAALAMGADAWSWLTGLDGFEALVIGFDGSQRHTAGTLSSRLSFAPVSHGRDRIQVDRSAVINASGTQ